MIQNVQNFGNESSYQNGLLSEKFRSGSVSTPEKKKCLNMYWDEIVKNNSLSDEFDVETFFRIIRERLNSPEKEIRQHALRVLKDFIPVVNPRILEANFNSILVDILHNLGNTSPSIRRSCIDCLYMYVKYSDDSDNSLKNIVFTGMYKEPNNSQLKTNTVAGLIIALPNFLLPHISQDTFYYIITALFNKLIQVTYQELALKALLKTEQILGKERFRSILNICGYENREKDLELLCEVYGINPEQLQDYELDKVPFQVGEIKDKEDEDPDEDFDGIVSESVTIKQPREEDVILEAEIKLDSGDAITMKVHEENSSISPFDSEDDKIQQNGRSSDSKDDTTDEEKRNYYPRSPRKVRFGGEVIKMRTPDSDANSSQTSGSNNGSDFSKDSKKSNIPIPIRKTNGFRENNGSDESDDRPSVVEIKKSFIPIRKSNNCDIPKSFFIYPDQKNDQRFFPDASNKKKHFSFTNNNEFGSRIKNNNNNYSWNDYNDINKFSPKNFNREDLVRISNDGVNNNHKNVVTFRNVNSNHSPSKKFNVVDKDGLRSKGQMNNGVPMYFNVYNPKKGPRYSSATSLIPIPGRRDRSNHSAPEIYYNTKQENEPIQNSRFCGNEPIFVIENNNGQKFDYTSKSPSIASSHSTSDSRSSHSGSKKSITLSNLSLKQPESQLEEITGEVPISGMEKSPLSEKSSPKMYPITPGISQTNIDDFYLPSGNHDTPNNQNKPLPPRFNKNLNLSKSDSDLRFNGKHREERTFANSAPSTVKNVSFTPLNESNTTPNISDTASSMPDSLNVAPEANKVATPRIKTSRLLSNLKNNSSKSLAIRRTPRNKKTEELQKQKPNLNLTMTQLESKDWETTMKGLKAISVLIKDNSVQLNGHLHSVCVLIGKHVRSLRSQVARSACSATSELFLNPIKGLEIEMEDLASALFNRTADTNKFLRSDAKDALEKMCNNLPPTRVIAVILNKGVSHHNPLVKCEAARLLDQVIRTFGYDKVFQLPKDTRDKILKTAANLLGEGCYDTRKHAQNLLLYLCQHKYFWKSVVNILSPSNVRAVGALVQKRISIC